MIFEKKEQESVSEYVVQMLQKAIRAGELKFGEQIPSEVELAEKLGVGRSSVREAVKVLVTFGLLEIRRGQGTFVTDNFLESIFSILGFSMAGGYIEDLLVVRQVLEGGCTRLIYNQLTEADCDELEKLTEQLDSSKNSSEENAMIDGAFHKRLIGFTNNQMMIRIYSMITKQIASLLTMLMEHEAIVTTAKKKHMEIIEALRKQDLEQLSKNMNEHLSVMDDYVIQYLPNCIKGA